MAENEILINPDQPAPTPPAPAPSPDAASTSPADLKVHFDTIVRMLRGVGVFLPAGPKATLDKLLGVLDLARQQDWLFEVLATVLTRFVGEQAVPEQFRQAVFEALVVAGDQVAADGRAAATGSEAGGQATAEGRTAAGEQVVSSHAGRTTTGTNSTAGSTGTGTPGAAGTGNGNGSAGTGTGSGGSGGQ